MENTKPKPFCFILMPFDDKFADIYSLGIKDACNDAGAYCERVDEQIFKERILDRIFNQIAKADIVIADMTDKNPNVFYEVGYAHAIGKTTILLTQKAEDIPFDLKHFSHIVYNNKIVDLKKELTKRIKWFIDNPSIRVEEKLAIEIYTKEINLSNDNVIIGYPKGKTYVEIPLTFYNNSNVTLYGEDFKVGVIGSSRLNSFYSGEELGINLIELPDSKVFFMLPSFKTFFPSAYSYFLLDMTFKEPEDYEELIIRVFTTGGTRDYIFKVNFK